MIKIAHLDQRWKSETDFAFMTQNRAQSALIITCTGFKLLD